MSAVIVDLQRRISELEETIRRLEKDKEELYDDLEGRLVKRERSFWSTSSSVLADRLTQADNDRRRLRVELNRTSEERDSLREDNVQILSAKRETDAISKSEMEKNRVLERELTFYKKQCARALEERNLYSYEVEELKRANLELERSLEETSERLDDAVRSGEELDRQRQEATTQVQHLEERLLECARIPELEAQLQSSRHQRNELQSQYNKLQSLYKVLQEDNCGAWLTIDQLKEEKEMLQVELKDVQEQLTHLIDTEKNRNSDLERKLEESTTELVKRNSQLQDADSKVAAAQAQAELFKESHQQEVNEARVEAHETIARLRIQLEETEGLLTRKMAEVQAAVEAKVTALENASEWESKWLAMCQKVQELEQQKEMGEKTAVLSRRSLEIKSFRTTRSDRHLWFRRRSRQEEEPYPQPSPFNSDSLTDSLDLVLGLVPKLKAIYEALEAAEPARTRSRRISLSRLETVQSKVSDLQKELESYPMSPHLDDAAGRLSAHVKIGMEAVQLSQYGIARLKQFINAVI